MSLSFVHIVANTLTLLIAKLLLVYLFIKSQITSFDEPHVCDVHNNFGHEKDNRNLLPIMRPLCALSAKNACYLAISFSVCLSVIQQQIFFVGKVCRHLCSYLSRLYSPLHAHLITMHYCKHSTYWTLQQRCCLEMATRDVSNLFSIIYFICACSIQRRSDSV